MPADILYLDCRSRPPTFSTLIVLLRNDSGGVASYSYYPTPVAGLRYNFHTTGINRETDYGCVLVIASLFFPLGLDLKYACVILDPFAVLNITFRNRFGTGFTVSESGCRGRAVCIATIAIARTLRARICIGRQLLLFQLISGFVIIHPSVQHWGDIIILYNIRINGLGTGCVRRPKIRVCSAWRL